jgi:predicted nucleic acid-binding protein
MSISPSWSESSTLAEPAVLDTSPLLHLARAGSLALLAVLGSRWVIPAEVAAEVRAKGATDGAAREIEMRAGFVLPPPLEIPKEISSRQLGRGESAVLAWAQAHPGSLAILDDFKARSLAEELGIALIGTLGIVVRAKRAGLLLAARPVIENLVGGGMYVWGALLERVFRLLGEE